MRPTLYLPTTTTLFLLPSLSAAFISSMALPTTASIGSSISVTVKAEGYIMTYDNFGIVWGLLPSYPSYNCAGCLGRRIAWTDLV
jgi:hypothetical protein